MGQQGFGKIGVITSVSGVRARPKNFEYGAAKAAVSAYLQGLRCKLHESNIEVYDFKLGPVNTPMTKNDHRHLLFTSPEVVARAITRLLDTKKYTSFVPQYWALIYAILKLLPDNIFRKIHFRGGHLTYCVRKNYNIHQPKPPPPKRDS